MSNCMFEKGRDSFLNAGINYASDTIKVALANIASYGLAISAATNATPIVVTTATQAWSVGDVVMIWGVVGNTAANGIFRAKAVTTTTVTLQTVDAGTDVAGNGAYTSGGRIINLTAQQFLSDATTAGLSVVGTAGALASKTSTGGVASAATQTFSAVSGSAVGALLIYKDTGTAGTSNLIGYVDTASAGLPVTPNGGDITVTWDTGNLKIFKL